MNKVLDLYSDYLISQNKLPTATGLSDLMDGQISHDKVTIILKANQAAMKELLRLKKLKSA